MRSDRCPAAPSSVRADADIAGKREVGVVVPGVFGAMQRIRMAAATADAPFVVAPIAPVSAKLLSLVPLTAAASPALCPNALPSPARVRPEAAIADMVLESMVNAIASPTHRSPWFGLRACHVPAGAMRQHGMRWREGRPAGRHPSRALGATDGKRAQPVMVPSPWRFQGLFVRGPSTAFTGLARA